MNISQFKGHFFTVSYQNSVHNYLSNEFKIISITKKIDKYD